VSDKRILHVCPYLHPSAGGPVVVVCQYAERLARHGYTPSILTTDWYSPGGVEELEARYAERYDLTVLETGNNFLKMFTPGIRKVIGEQVANSDLLHVHGLWHAVGMRAMMEARKLGKPYVVSPHGMLDPYSMSIRPLRKRLYWSLVESRNLRFSSRILFTTDEERRLATEAVGRLEPNDVILLGADDPPDRDRESLKGEALQAYPALQGKRVILFLGRLHEKKGLHLAVSFLGGIVKTVPDAILCVVGDGEDGYQDHIHSEIERLGLRDHVCFTGLLEGREKWSVIAAADLFVLPSSQENFGLAVAEVMKIGVPVVISDRVNLAPYVRSANAGVVLSLESPGHWVRAMTDLLRDNARLEVLSNNSLKMSDALFSWDLSTRNLATVYGDILGANA